MSVAEKYWENGEYVSSEKSGETPFSRVPIHTPAWKRVARCMRSAGVTAVDLRSEVVATALPGSDPGPVVHTQCTSEITTVWR